MDMEDSDRIRKVKHTVTYLIFIIIRIFRDFH